jgi:hypothetical protein
MLQARQRGAAFSTCVRAIGVLTNVRTHCTLDVGLEFVGRCVQLAVPLLHLGKLLVELVTPILLRTQKKVGCLLCESPEGAVNAGHTLGAVVHGQEQVTLLAVDYAHASVAVQQRGELVLGEPAEILLPHALDFVGALQGEDFDDVGVGAHAGVKACKPLAGDEAHALEMTTSVKNALDGRIIAELHTRCERAPYIMRSYGWLSPTF